MGISMRGTEQPFLDLPPAGEPGRHRIGRRPTASYRAVFAVREFRTLWSAQALSYLGDQVAQVAIAVLVYAKTGSPLITALVYALTYLPPILGGRLLNADQSGDAAAAAAVISEMLAETEVALVHARALEFGCFAFEARRV